jgi:hypothetical protein
MSKELGNQYTDELMQLVAIRFLRKYYWIIEPSRKHSIPIILLQNILDFLEEVPSLKKEGESLNLGLVVKNQKTELIDSFIEKKDFHISKFSNFLDLRSVVDGSLLCYLVDEAGLVKIERIPAELLKANACSTLQNVSLKFQTITFCVRESSSEIYDSGEMIRINRKGFWVKPCAMPLCNLDKEGFPLSLLELVFELCLKMSAMNKSGTFVILRDENSKHYSTMVSDCKFRKCKVDQLTQSDLINLATIDGAVIMSTDNNILTIGQRLEPPPSSGKYKESGRGTRHNSAALYSEIVDSVVFVVSNDGPVSLYFRGELYARCFDELFGFQ